MTTSQSISTRDMMILRFTGVEGEGHDLHELRALHVAEVLAGLAEFTKDLDQAGVFHDPENAGESIVYVKPPEEGSFWIEVVRTVAETMESHPVVTASVTAGVPTLSGLLAFATKSVRAQVADFAELGNGNIKITWSDKTAQEVTREAWEALNKNPRRTKKQLGIDAR